MQLLVVGAESGAQDNRLERRESKFKFGNVRYLTYKVEEPRDADEDLENDPLAHQVLTTNINTTSLGECAMVGLFSPVDTLGFTAKSSVTASAKREPRRRLCLAWQAERPKDYTRLVDNWVCRKSDFSCACVTAVLRGAKSHPPRA